MLEDGRQHSKIWLIISDRRKEHPHPYKERHTELDTAQMCSPWGGGARGRAYQWLHPLRLSFLRLCNCC